jgi:hypothetical protein
LILASTSRRRGSPIGSKSSTPAVDTRRWPSSRREARSGHWRRHQSRRHDPALLAALADRFLPGGNALHPTRAGGPRGARNLRRARGLDRDLRALRLGNPWCGVPGPGALYRYQPAEPAIVSKAERILDVCRRHHVPLAACSSPLGHRSVASVIPGPVASEEVRQNLAWLRQPIPEALWAELKAERLIRAEAPTPRLNGPA